VIDEQDKALLSAEQAGELTACERMFGSAGWSLLTTNLQNEYESYAKAYDAIADLNQLGKAQGIRYALLRVLKYPELIAAHYSALAAEAGQVGPEPEAPETDDNWA
jgi:hypothetical protein